MIVVYNAHMEIHNSITINVLKHYVLPCHHFCSHRLYGIVDFNRMESVILTRTQLTEL